MQADNSQRVIDVFLDMETGDPDDCITLLFMMSHSHVALRGITVFPGCPRQIGFIKGLIRTYGKEFHQKMSVGCFTDKHTKNHLGENNVKLFGNDVQWKPEEADDFGHEILASLFKKYPSGRLITGGPLGNLHDLLVNHPEIEIDQVFIQGGYAGSRCISPENQLAKFRGKITCPTFNFNGHPKGAFEMLNSDKIQKRHLISKDVCHGVPWSSEFHRLVVMHKKGTSPWWNMIIESMASYLKRHPEGKLLHDPLAAATCLNPEIITFMEVTCQRERGEWGSFPTPGTRTYISVGVNIELFYSVFLEIPLETVVRDLSTIRTTSQPQRGPQKKKSQPKEGSGDTTEADQAGGSRKQEGAKKSRVQGNKW